MAANACGDEFDGKDRHRVAGCADGEIEAGSQGGIPLIRGGANGPAADEFTQSPTGENVLSVTLR
ncbi:hypothetical protein [Melissospora conviva]|uniref:hypothetical protein n=1 Tax=Melissospora conviva TaxID=3388432 RepID=UPI003C219E91